MSVIVTTLLFISVAFWISWLWSRRKFYLASLKFPGPWAYPIVGNAIEMGAFGKGHGTFFFYYNKTIFQI